MATVDFVGRGWAFPMGVDMKGEIALSSGSDKLEQAMRLVLATYPGERPMRHEFGSRLRDFVFEPITGENIGRLTDEVRSALRRWEPRVDITEVRVYPDDRTEGALLIDIDYVVKGTNDRRNLVFPFYTIPWGEEE